MKILLDPGHGPGKKDNRGSLIGNEGDNNYAFSVELKKELEKYGFQVGTTRLQNRENPSLKERGHMAKNYDLFISLHSNAGPPSARGMEIYGDINNNNPSLMRALIDGTCREMGIVNRGIRYRTRKDGRFHIQDHSPGGSNYYGVLYHNRAKVAMLVEFVFHSNWEDCQIYVHRRSQLAKVFAKILADYYNKKEKYIISCYITGYEKAQEYSKKLECPLLPHDYYNYTKGSWKEFKDKNYKIIAIGGVRSNHSSYCDEFIPGK
ncbi:MAG: N-acetylmuramoyl-L-alanine amidase [Tissierellia bacterium]|nr:N-acetylmuramoyl-L-alanine amidase [Tissierellia bacterium]